MELFSVAFFRTTTRCDRGEVPDYVRPERRFPFYFRFKKRQVEMTTLSSRGFVQVPSPVVDALSPLAGIQSHKAFEGLPRYFRVILTRGAGAGGFAQLALARYPLPPGFFHYFNGRLQIAD